MRITTDHAASSYGIPVILDDEGAVMDPGPGLQAVRKHLGLSTAQVGELTGRSKRTIEDYEQGRYAIPAHVLYVLAERLRV